MGRGRLLGTTALNWSSPNSRIQVGTPPARSGKTTVSPADSAFDFSMKPHQRGVIISNPLVLDGRAAYIESSDVEPSELRRALLFWDKIIWPSTNGIYFDGGVDVEFLEGEGKVIRPHFIVSGDAATALSMSFAETYKILEKSHPGQWVVSRGIDSLRIHGREIIDGRGIITQLINAIPVPDRNMPLEDLIRFKESRAAEVIALRAVIDEFYQSWINSEDQEHQLHLALAKIDAASADMIRVARQSRLPFSMSTWKINFNITVPDIVKSAALALGALNHGLGATSSLLAGGMSLVSFGSDIGVRTATKNSPFNYVASLERDLH